MDIDKQNIFLHDTAEEVVYSSAPKPWQPKIPDRNRRPHGKKILRQYKEIWKNNANNEVTSIPTIDGQYIEFISAIDYALISNSLEDIKQGIFLLNERKTKTPDGVLTHATVFIPLGKEHVFLKKLQDYLSPDKDTKNGPKNKKLISSIEKVQKAVIQSLWTSNPTSIPSSNREWCEIWIRLNKNYFGSEAKAPELGIYIELCKALKIQIRLDYLQFPERVVFLSLVNYKDLEELVRCFPNIAEFRGGSFPTDFFINMGMPEQASWTDELLERIAIEHSEVAVCILDTGLNSGHPLLNQSVPDEGRDAVREEWGKHDHHRHGTNMAGTALFFNLGDCLETAGQIILSHNIESIKILPPVGGNKFELYGSIMRQAIYKAEINVPDSKKVYCMAVTATDGNITDGSPSSWSGAIDATTAGVNDDIKRLLIISAGNVSEDEFASNHYPKANYLHPVESPAQAWNALSVGAVTTSIKISNPIYKDYEPVALQNDLSPYSSTSLLWGKGWPIKPEILLEGGNIITNGEKFDCCDDLALVTTHHMPTVRLFDSIWGTSSATAQAAWMAAQINVVYPGIWPETVRGLIVQSASWTKQMRSRFCRDDSKTAGRRTLLRMCGYGVPDFNKAIQCFNNNVNLIVQDELQPYTKSGSGIKMNEMHIHELPWPKKVLQELGDTTVVLKVTLSYFIEPGLGEIGWKNKYRYPSCQLRFDVNTPQESKDEFEKRISIAMRDEEYEKDSTSKPSERWYLGESRNVGSIHSDYIEGTAAEISESNVISVYPVTGWWKSRAHLGMHSRKIRYSLIVSLSTPEIETDIYSSVITQIETKAAIEIPVINEK